MTALISWAESCVCATGHDEDPAKAALGTPLERIMKMGTAMLEAVRAFKPTSSDGKKFEIRLGWCTVIHTASHCMPSPSFEHMSHVWSPAC